MVVMVVYALLTSTQNQGGLLFYLFTFFSLLRDALLVTFVTCVSVCLRVCLHVFGGILLFTCVLVILL